MRRRGRGAGGGSCGQVGGDVGQGAQGSQVLRADGRGAGEAFLERGEYFDALDGVDAQIGIHAHVQFQHFLGVAGFFADRPPAARRLRCRVAGAALADGVTTAAIAGAAGACTGSGRAGNRVAAWPPEGPREWQQSAGPGTESVGKCSPGAGTVVCSSRVWMVRPACSCPSRKRRCNWAVSSCIFCSTLIPSRVRCVAIPPGASRDGCTALAMGWGGR